MGGGTAKQFLLVAAILLLIAVPGALAAIGSQCNDGAGNPVQALCSPGMSCQYYKCWDPLPIKEGVYAGSPPAWWSSCNLGSGGGGIWCEGAACSNECTLGQQRCFGDARQQCVTGASGCTVWGNVEDCSPGGCEPSPPRCVECTWNGDCTGGWVCDLSDNQCVQCLTNAQCGGSTPRCNTATNACVQCTTNSHCPAGEECSANACVPLPCTNDCNAGESMCVSGTTYKVCGQYDADSCLEWSPSVASCGGASPYCRFPVNTPIDSATSGGAMCGACTTNAQCNDPPDYASCNGNAVEGYNVPGTCNAGICTYTSSSSSCSVNCYDDPYDTYDAFCGQELVSIGVVSSGTGLSGCWTPSGCLTLSPGGSAKVCGTLNYGPGFPDPLPAMGLGAPNSGYIPTSWPFTCTASAGSNGVGTQNAAGGKICEVLFNNDHPYQAQGTGSYTLAVNSGASPGTYTFGLTSNAGSQSLEDTFCVQIGSGGANPCPSQGTNNFYGCAVSQPSNTVLESTYNCGAGNQCYRCNVAGGYTWDPFTSSCKLTAGTCSASISASPSVINDGGSPPLQTTAVSWTLSSGCAQAMICRDGVPFTGVRTGPETSNQDFNSVACDSSYDFTVHQGTTCGGTLLAETTVSRSCSVCTPSPEICDGISNDCDAQIDEGCDDDRDGYADAGMTCTGTFLDGNGFTQSCGAKGGDCNDANAAVNPGATDICGDSIDNDCDSSIDETCCTDLCSPSGVTQCSSGTEYRQCGDYNGDGCFEWSAGTTCGNYNCAGDSCSGSTTYYDYPNLGTSSRLVADRSCSLGGCAAAAPISGVCAPVSETCNAAKECNTASINCGGGAWEVCRYSNLGNWRWETVLGGESACTDNHDNNCNGESDHDSLDGLHGDIGCPVQIVGIGVTNSNPGVGSVVDIACTASVGSVNSIFAYIDENNNGAFDGPDRDCGWKTGSGWSGTQATFKNCNVGTAGLKAAACGVYSSPLEPFDRSYQTGNDIKQVINVEAAGCGSYPDAVSCNANSSCTWINQCRASSPMFSGLIGGACVPIGNTPAYTCSVAQCGEACDGSTGCPALTQCTGSLLQKRMGLCGAACSCSYGTWVNATCEESIAASCSGAVCSDNADCGPLLVGDQCRFSSQCLGDCTCTTGTQEYCPAPGTVNGTTCHYGSQECLSGGCSLFNCTLAGGEICNPASGCIPAGSGIDVNIDSPTDSSVYPDSNIDIDYRVLNAVGSASCTLQIDGMVPITYPLCSNTTLSEALIPSSGKLGAYDFSERNGTTAFDRSGNDRAGTLNGATRVFSGKYGQAANLDGVDDYLSFGNTFNVDKGTRVSFSLWVYPRSYDRFLFAKQDNWVNGRGYGTYLHPSGAISFSLLRDQATDAIWASGGSLPLNAWSHVAVTYDGSGTASGIRIYVNGLATALSYAGGPLVGSPLGDEPFQLGCREGCTYNRFDGMFDELVIYNRVLSAAEIQDIATDKAFDGVHQLRVTAADSAANFGASSTDFFINVLLNARMRGKVTNEAGQPLSGAIVSIITSPSNLLDATDSQGNYSIIDIPAGTHEVSAIKPGYQQAVVQESFPLGATITRDFMLGNGSCYQCADWEGRCSTACSGAPQCGATVPAVCAGALPGQWISYNSTDSVLCCQSNVFKPKLNSNVTYGGCMDDLVTIDRLVRYHGQLTTLRVFTWQPCGFP